MSYTDVLTTAQIAKERPFLNESTLRWYRMNGTGPKSFRIGKRVYYRLSEVDQWLAQQEAATTVGGAA